MVKKGSSRPIPFLVVSKKTPLLILSVGSITNNSSSPRRLVSLSICGLKANVAPGKQLLVF